MPRVRLRIHHYEPPERFRTLYTERRRPGEWFEFPVLRLATTSVFGPDPPDFRDDKRTEARALIDTGAWVTVIERVLWERLDRLGLIEFLPPPAGVTLPRTLIGGGRSEYRIGRVAVALLDRDGPNPPRRLPASPVIAQLLLDPDVRLPYPVVFGMHHGVLDGRRLWREVVMGGNGGTYDRTDAGPHFGQQWYLEPA